MGFETFVGLTLSGLTVGMIYALVALGYTMVYGVLKLINFAHGEIFTVGGYLGATFLIWIGIEDGIPLPLKILYVILAFLFSMILTATLGWSVERFAYRPLRKMTRIAPLLSAIGVSIFLQNLILLVFGVDPIIMPVAAIPEGYIPVFGANFRYLAVIIIVFSLILMGGLTLFIKKTRLGKAMRATSQDREAAEMMGINTNMTISLTFIIGSALAAIAGILVAMYYGTLKFDTGFLYGIKAFTAAVLGGIGNIPGAVIGALVLGLAENYGVGLKLGILAYFFILGLIVGLAYQFYFLPREARKKALFNLADRFSYDEGSLSKVKILNYCYYGGWISGFYFLFKERRDSLVRIHARQAIRVGFANTFLFLVTLIFFLNSNYKISSEWQNGITFLVLMLVLIFKPAGILGEHIPEKV